MRTQPPLLPLAAVFRDLSSASSSSSTTTCGSSSSSLTAVSPSTTLKSTTTYDDHDGDEQRHSFVGSLALSFLRRRKRLRLSLVAAVLVLLALATLSRRHSPSTTTSRSLRPFRGELAHVATSKKSPKRPSAIADDSPASVFLPSFALAPELEPVQNANANANAGGSKQRGSKGGSSRANALSSLGREADLVYSLGTLQAREYATELDAFLRDYWPATDSTLSPPPLSSSSASESSASERRQGRASTRQLMRTYLRHSGAFSGDMTAIDDDDDEEEYDEAIAQELEIPSVIYHTARDQADYAKTARAVNSWRVNHPKWNITMHDDASADAWVRARFAGSRILDAWDALASPPVLRADLWRYLVLACNGGVYADTDATCLKPFERWSRDPEHPQTVPVAFTTPALIVGVEADVGDRLDWHEWWPRPLQIAQWTLASARGHPVLIDTIRRVVLAALDQPLSAPLPSSPPTSATSSSARDRDGGGGRKMQSVMERTGPGPFTDSVLRYVRAKWGKTWADLRALPDQGWRHGLQSDTLVLSITGFSAGVGTMNAGDDGHRAAMVRHGFRGSWRTQEGVDG